MLTTYVRNVSLPLRASAPLTTALSYNLAHSMYRPSLFCLPRELRDEVYRYALHHAQGLLYRVSKSGDGKIFVNVERDSGHKCLFAWRPRCRSQSSRWAEHNPLKYVCKSLREETQGVALRHNLVYFEDCATMNAIDQCIPLLQRRVGLRQIAIKCQSIAGEDARERMAAVVKHCAIHADVLVRMHVPSWSQADPDFVQRGLAYLWQLRGDMVLLKRLARVTTVTHLISSDLPAVDTRLPVNLRFHPWEAAFNSQLFAQACRERPLLTFPSTKAVIGDVESLATTWITCGL
jgi:hypothetical protein